MANPIFHSAYTAQQIEDEITNGVPKVVNGYWYRWDIATSAWVNTGVKSGVEPPYVVTLAADMTDTGLTYIYIGSEAGYTFGHWYYWDGAQWVDGGAFLAAPADSELSYTSTNAVQNKVITPAVLNAYPTATIENAPIASFSDGADNITPKTLIVNIDPAQAAGTPSPDNPLAISGWTEANIVVSPTQDVADGTTYTVSWQNEAGAVYGGTLADNHDGTWTLTINRALIQLNAVAWEDVSDSVFRSDDLNSANVPYAIDTTIMDGLVASSYAPVSYSVTVANMGNNEIKRGGTNSTVRRKLYVKDERYSTAADWLADMGNQTVCYPIPERTFPLTGESVTTLLGDNNIFADTGNIAEMTYRADPTLYINGKINAVMAAIAEI